MNDVSPSQLRRGSLLVIVAGLSAMLAVLTLTYLAGVRGRSHDGSVEVAAAQSRILLYSACAFICESRNQGGTITTSGGFSGQPYEGGVPNTGAVAPYQIIPRQWPAFAIGVDPTMGPATQQWLDDPTKDINTGSGVSFARWISYPGSPTDTWFRLYHESGPATGIAGTHNFLVTVGIGQTYGYRTWAEVLAIPVPGSDAEHGMNYARDIPATNIAEFDELHAREHREYFRVTWDDPGMAGNPTDVATSKPWFGRITQITPLAIEPGSW